MSIRELGKASPLRARSIVAQLAVVVAAATMVPILGAATLAARAGAHPFLLTLSGACLFACVLAVFVYAARRRLEPVDQMVGFLTSLSGADLNERLGERSQTIEFARLRGALNGFLDRLQRTHQALEERAFSDPQTGLANQERFVREIEEALLARGESHIALVAFQLERVSGIIDTIGREGGEAFLAQIVARMRAAIVTIDRIVAPLDSHARPSVLARLHDGGFGVLVSCVRSSEDAARYVQYLIGALNQPVDFRDHKLTLGPVIGAAILPQDGHDADTALRHATIALSAAKTEPTRLRFFAKSLERKASSRLSLEREMRGALERGEFRAHFQPKVDFASGRVVGSEALARWIRQDRAHVTPGRFIAAAEENGLIGPISETILRDACWKAAAWCREGLAANVAVNISPLQFADERFPDKILRMVNEAGLSPRRLELEITESVALENPERAEKLLRPLREEGVRIALDDFGCGHSNLAILTRLPLDIIKIDQQFVRGLSSDRHAPAIVEMILAMAESLNFEVVAEGVETEWDAEFLSRRRCHIGQGFLYGAAAPPQEFIRFAMDRNDDLRGRAVGVA